jgi:hypothetical protein
MSSPPENLLAHSNGNHIIPILAEAQIRANPLKSLKEPEPIPDVKGSLTSDQLREIAKHRQPPAAWFEGDEEQLF